LKFEDHGFLAGDGYLEISSNSGKSFEASRKSQSQKMATKFDSLMQTFSIAQSSKSTTSINATYELQRIA